LLSPVRKREVARAAQVLLSRHGVDMSRQIDVFELVHKVGLVLRFKQLEGLLGAFVPGVRGGILVNSERSIPLQRYTAAHEIGHWALHLAEFSLDSEQEVDGTTPDRLEQEAQLFASHLLMPLPLISRAARDADIRLGVAPTGEQIYKIAGTMGVSFTAAIVHLQNVNLLTREHATAAKRIRPVSIQVSRTFGERLIPTDAHVWSPSEFHSTAVRDLYVGDIVAVDLPENRTTGYRWFVSAPAPELPVTDEAEDLELGILEEYDEDEEPVEGPAIAFDSFRADGAPAGKNELAVSGIDPFVAVGNGGRRRLLIRASRDGQWRAILSYAPAHRPGDAIETTVLDAETHPRPALQQRRYQIDSYNRRSDGEVTT